MAGIVSLFSTTWRNDLVRLLSGGGASSGALVQSGTWTPSVSTTGTAFTGVAYGDQLGEWAAINLGSGAFLVWAAFRLQFTPNVGSASGNLNIDGLGSAFTMAGAFSWPGPVARMNDDWSWTSNRTMVVALADSGDNAIRLDQLGSGQNPNLVGVANLTDAQEHLVHASVVFKATKA